MDVSSIAGSATLDIRKAISIVGRGKGPIWEVKGPVLDLGLKVLFTKGFIICTAQI
jgi:hypothetical protein